MERIASDQRKKSSVTRTCIFRCAAVWAHPTRTICRLEAFGSLLQLLPKIVFISELPSKAQAFLYKLIDMQVFQKEGHKFKVSSWVYLFETPCSIPEARKDSPDFRSFPKMSVVPVTHGLFAIHFHSDSDSGGELVLWGISGRGRWVLLHSLEKLELKMWNENWRYRVPESTTGSAKRLSVYVILCKVPKSLQSKLVTCFRVSFEVTAVVRGSKEVCHAGRPTEE